MSIYSIAPFIQTYYPEYWGRQSYPVKQCARIRKAKEEWGVLGNFAKTPIIVNGITFDCAERLFHLMKLRTDSMEGIRQMMDGELHDQGIKMHMKHIQKHHADWLRDDWPSMVLDAMKFCLVKKHEQSEVFRSELERSKGLFIVEDQTSFPKKEPDAWGVKPQGDNFVGPNLLGRFLMELRDKGTLTYRLPDDGLAFIEVLKAEQTA